MACGADRHRGSGAAGGAHCVRRLRAPCGGLAPVSGASFPLGPRLLAVRAVRGCWCPRGACAWPAVVRGGAVIARRARLWPVGRSRWRAPAEAEADIAAAARTTCARTTRCALRRCWAVHGLVRRRVAPCVAPARSGRCAALRCASRLTPSGFGRPAVRSRPPRVSVARAAPAARQAGGGGGGGLSGLSGNN